MSGILIALQQRKIAVCGWLLLFMLALLAVQRAECSVVNPTCPFKDNCNLDENVVLNGDGSSDAAAANLEEKIVSLFEDKINYSLKLLPNTHAGAEVFPYAIRNNDSNPSLADNYTLTTNERRSSSSSSGGSNDTNAIDIEEDERVYVQNIRQRFLSMMNIFDPSRNPETSDLCRAHVQRYLTGLRDFDLWALKMYDATGKMNSGILNGNINQLGNFDQCLNIEHHYDGDGDGDGDGDEHANQEIRGKYCLAYAQPTFAYKSKRLQKFFKLIQSHGPFKSEFNDPGHRVPRYSLINWGICVPAACNHRDIEFSIREYLENITQGTGISFQVRVEPRMCQSKGNQHWDRNTIWAVRFFLIVLSIVALSTIYDCRTCAKNQSKKQIELFTVFSLYKNGSWLFSTRASNDDIQTVHGIRFLNAMMLLFSHKSMAIFFSPYDNRTEMAESLGQPWTVIGRAASLYTDPFLLFSGMLTSYSFFGRLLKKQPIHLKHEYINRLLRIMPPLAALILFCTYVLPLMGSGPQWNLVVGHHADICKRNWWRNLLFIHNYFGFSEMCLTHTHHLGIDTELFAIAPLMIYALAKWPRRGLQALLLICACGTAARYFTTIANQLSNYIYFGTNIQRLFRTADYMYSFPPYRSTVYIMGILLGYGLRKYPRAQLSNAQLRTGWFVATVCVLASLFGPAPMGDISYQYNPTHAAIYAAFVPIAWCLFFSWIVFVSHNGYTNKFTNIFAWHGFQVTTKLSYAIYLTQFPVFFYNVGRRRHVHHYYNFVSVIFDTNELLSIFLTSIALTLVFDAPFQNLKKLLNKPRTTSFETQHIIDTAPMILSKESNGVAGMTATQTTCTSEHVHND